MKAAYVSHYFSRPGQVWHQWLVDIIRGMSMLYQTAGVINLERTLRNRMFVLMFGGKDSTLRDGDRALWQAYQARLTRSIWQAASGPFQACVWISTFNDRDLQQIMLQEDVKLKKRSLNNIRARRDSVSRGWDPG